jgi:FdhE protein
MIMTKNNGQKKRESSDAALLKVKERIDHVSRKRPSHKAAITFFKGIITEKIRAKAGVEVESVEMDESVLNVKRNEGFPLVDKRDLKLDISSATALFKRLCERLNENEKVSQDMDRITEAVDSGELDLEELFKKAVEEDHEYMVDLSNRFKLQRGLLFFVAENSLQPIFEAYADKLKDYVDQQTWWRSYCPICGSKPVMAELIGRKRKKFLICSCCGYEWRFMRTKCPFCENEERRKFKYFYTEDEGRAYRVETCQKCKKYIKTVDTEELDEEVIPWVDDISTLYLDVLAQKEGYTREVHPLGLNLGDL